MNGKISRRYGRAQSDIDSLSPQVLEALQSTFAGKLDDIRAQTPKPASPLPAAREAAAPSPSEAKMEKEESVEAGREGTYMMLAYLSAIVMSVFIMMAAEGKRHEVECGERVDSKCMRLVGYILPIALTALYVTVALVFFVFNVSFALYNVLVTTEECLWRAGMKAARSERLPDEGIGLSVAGAALVFTIDVAFIVASGASLWLAKIVTVDPLYVLCHERQKLIWMLGFILIATAIFSSAIASFRNPSLASSHIRKAATLVIYLVLVFSLVSAFYYFVSPPEAARQCAPPEETGNRRYPPDEKHELVPYTTAGELCEWSECGAIEQQQCGEARQDEWCLASYDKQQCPRRSSPPKELPAARTDPDVLMCPPREPEDVCEAMAQCPRTPPPELCEPRAAQVCEWPWTKRMQVYEHKDRCGYDLRQCAWPLSRRVQVYEREDVCKYGQPECEWPRVKRVQVYECAGRCSPLGHPYCDWPFLKQIRSLESEDRCSEKDRLQCDWPVVKQIQLYEPRDRCPSLDQLKCDWPVVKRIQLYDFHVRECGLQRVHSTSSTGGCNTSQACAFCL